MLTLLALQTLMNPGFEDGLAGWRTEGDARVETEAPLAGRGSLHIAGGAGAARRTYAVPGGRVLSFGATLRADGPARIRLQCLDARGKVLLDRDAGADPKKDAGIYLKTHASTRRVVLSVEKGETGTLVADNVVLKDDGAGRVEHKPTVDLDAAMRPFWLGDRVVDESVLLLSSGGAPARGRLLFRPTKVLAVRDGTRTYRDFAVEGDELVARGSAIPTVREAEFAKGEYPWTDLAGRHVSVTYLHAGAWRGPVPASQADRLPETTARLRAKRPLTVVAYGDSITLGMNVSGFRNVPPYLPPWPDLFARELRKRDPKVRLFNAALGGTTSDWGRDNAGDIVASLDPDLVVVAFGMNDFWSNPPEAYRKNVEAIMATVRARRPRCEFLLVAPMRFDPAYTAEAPYLGNLLGYAAALRGLAGRGVAFLDMTALSGALYDAKGAKGLVSDPMHPADFLARVYAQAAVATISPLSSPRGKAPDARIGVNGR